ncbi:Satratoxin biosynthesis SC17 cluster protein [Paramyrothecium foliicola]|nr:Satratoxin biosynthesis SC17 cluster protein [Paramyrothecium foliicola]
MSGSEDIFPVSFLSQPAAEAPAGEVPPDRVRMGITIFFMCFSITVGIWLVRVYVRVFVLKRVKLEDYLSVAGMGFYAGLSWIVINNWYHNRYFVHIWNMTMGELFEARYALYFLFIFYCGVMLFIKAAMILEWNRIFAPLGIRNGFWWTSHAILALNIAIYLSCGVALALNCSPIESSWKPSIPQRCGDFKAIIVSVAAFNLLMDLLILALPQWMIWKLTMSRSRKMGVSFIFSIGLLACGCAIGRLNESFTVQYPAGDVSYESSQTSLWIIGEVTCVVVAFCVPAVAPLTASGSLLGQALQSFCSWTRLTLLRSARRSKRSATEAAAFPPTIGSESRQHTYHHMSDEDGQISMAELINPATHAPVITADAADPENKNASGIGILKTMSFERYEQAAVEGPGTSATSRDKQAWCIV